MTVRSALVCLVLTALATGSGAKSSPVVVGDRSWDELERLNAYVLGDGNFFLGEITRNPYGQRSLANENTYGSPLRRDGLFNKIGRFGSTISSTSAFNNLAADPPEIVYEKNGKLVRVGYLTVNEIHKSISERYNSNKLRVWLRR
jgi:hypothetical protein